MTSKAATAVSGLAQWTAAGAAAGWAAVRLTGTDRWPAGQAPLAPLMSFTPQATAAAAAAAVLLRRPGPAAVATAAAGALAAVLMPRAAASRQPAADGPVLRVLTANLLVGRASAEAVVGLARRSGADVLFLQELTDSAVTRLKRAGLADLLPYQMADVRGESTHGSAIYARFPLADGLTLEPIRLAQPTARILLPGGPALDLVCVHPHPPAPVFSRPLVARWRRELAVLPGPGEPPRLLAGDFNTTLDHAGLRRLLRAGYVDAAAAAGQGLRPTWGPAGWPGLLTVDHVLADPRCAVLGVSVHRLPGSDHRAVFAGLRLPA
ncbi:MAG: endonuclease/exonuclease/phosphatase family protein [Streptosporangiaceae bacterium]